MIRDREWTTVLDGLAHAGVSMEACLPAVAEVEGVAGTSPSPLKANYCQSGKSSCRTRRPR